MASPTTISNLQWREADYKNSTFVDEAFLGNALMSNDEISRVLTYIEGDKYMLNYLTLGSGRTARPEKISGPEYRWPLMGALTHAVMINGAISPASSTPGINFTTFTIPFAENYFAEGDVLKVGNNQLLRVQDTPIQDGNSWLYSVAIITNNSKEFIAPEYLAEGLEVAYIGSAFEEYSEGGSSKTALPFWLRNQLTTCRKSFGMSGSADVTKLVLDFGNGKSLWKYKQMAENEKMWRQEDEYLMWYSRYNKTPQGEVMLPGKNGRPVRMGAGFLEQIATVNRRNYTVLTEKILKEFANDMQIMSRDVEGSKFVLFTGIDGMQAIADVLRSSITANNIIDTVFTSMEGQKLVFTPSRALTYRGVLNTEFTVMYNPIFDDKTKHTILNPLTGNPMESSRMVWANFGNVDGKSNISVVTRGADGVDRSMVAWYTAGSQTPDGGVSKLPNVMRSSALDGWEMHYLSEKGIMVRNPLSCGELYRTI